MGIVNPASAAGAVELLFETGISTPFNRVDITGVMNADFRNYILELSGVQVSADAVTLNLRYGLDGVFDAGANYEYALLQVAAGGYSSSVSGVAASGFPLVYSIEQDRPDENCVTGRFTLFDPLNDAQFKGITGIHGDFTSDGQYYARFGGGRYKSLSPCNCLRIITSAGNMTVGNFRLYGER